MMRKILWWGGALFVIGALVHSIQHKEEVVAHGNRLLLRLAPVDPRSLMQGDYMRLNYAISNKVRRLDDLPEDGLLVLKRDELDVGLFIRIHDETPLGEGEILLTYRLRNSRIRLGAESFLFEEGKAKHFEKAKFGILRVSSQGEGVLVGLCDERGEKL